MELAKYLFFFFVIPLAFGFDPGSVYSNPYLSVEDIIHRHNIYSKKGSLPSIKPPKSIAKYLNDPDNLIGKSFDIHPDLRDRVQFWFRIYTQFSSHHSVIHDKKNLALIYDAVDFSEIKKSKLNYYVKAKLQTKYSRQKVVQIKKVISTLAKNPYTKDKGARKLKKRIQSAGYKIPKNKRKAKKFYKNLAKNIRVQTGQRNMIFQGILNSLPFLPFIHHYMDYFEMPRELLAISFVESSFNTRAVSKVGASGVWQFMPNIAKRIMPMEKNYIDGRVNPLMASVSAFHLLKQNLSILKRWDLAVTAYNSGTKHLLRAKRKLKIPLRKLSLPTIFRRYKHPHLGFASKNFYSEFLALVYALAYKDKLYPLKGINTRRIKDQPNVDSKNLDIYISKCSVRPSWFYSQLKKRSPDIAFINRHLLRKKHKYPKGTVLFSDVPLTKRKYLKLTDKQVRRSFPKNWKKHVRNQSCSTR